MTIFHIYEDKTCALHLDHAHLDHAHEHGVLSRPAQVSHGELHREHVALLVDSDEMGRTV